MRYWIAGDDYEYGHDIANAVFSNLKRLKPDVQLIGQSWWKVGEADLTPYITQILAAKPDFIIVATGGSGMVNFQKAAKQRTESRGYLSISIRLPSFPPSRGKV